MPNTDRPLIKVESGETDSATDTTTFPTKAPSVSVLDQLRQELHRKVERPLIEIPVPERKGVSVRFSPNITQDQVRMWRTRAGDKPGSTKSVFDGLKFAEYVIGSTCVGIYLNGEQVTSKDGVGLTFASREIYEAMGADTPQDGIKLFYGLDPHVEAVAMKIMEAAGYTEEIEDVSNPTETS